MSHANLARLLAEAQDTIRALQEELAETNRGMVALTVELEGARETHQALFEDAVEGIFRTTPEGRYLAANPALAQLYGYDSPENIIRSLTDIASHLYVEPDRRAEFLRLMHEQGSVIGFESEIYRKDRSRAWIVESARVIRDRQGGVQCYEGFVVDITPRKQAEQALWLTQARMQAILDNALDAVIGLDEGGRITDWNPRAETIFGWAVDEAIGRDLAETIIPLQYREAHRRGLRHVLATGDGPLLNKRIELTALRRDGHEFPVELSILSLKLGAQYWFSAFVSDITARKQADAALRDSEATLRHALKMEAVGTLAGGIAHEFNNLLTVILGYSEMLLSSEAAGPARVELDHINTAANQAAALTRQLLAFSRRQMLQPTVVNLTHVVTALAPMLRQVLGESIELVLRLDPGLGLVMVDPGQLDQALLNLTLNARDAMRLPLHLNGEPRGPGGQLTIETAHVMLDDTAVSSLRTARFGPHVVLTVRDTGVGMNAATQCHIFEPFFTTKEVGQGTGLGLAMVEGFVTQSGGAIVVASEPGQGTTFTIYWPYMEGAVASSQAEAPQAAWPRGQDTILLVDDDDTIQLLVHRVLAASGYTVLDASTPVEALQIGLQYPHTIHLLLTDMVMPGMSGRELSDRLTPVRPGMKVLYMSGYTDDALVSHGVQAEGRAFLPKPFTPQVLTSTVRAVLDDMCDGGLSHGG